MGWDWTDPSIQKKNIFREKNGIRIRSFENSEGNKFLEYFSKIVREAAKKVIFLVAFTPPPLLVTGPLKKDFLRLPLCKRKLIEI